MTYTRGFMDISFLFSVIIIDIGSWDKKRKIPDKNGPMSICFIITITSKNPNYIILIFLAATKQLYEWYFLSVGPSVCLSVTPFWLCSHHRIIMKFSGVITTDQGNAHANSQGQRSKVKVTEVTTQLSRFRTVTPVWIHIWWWNDI